jgi:hypothetical protein
VKVTKEWVKKAAPVLIITLKIVQLAMTAYGIPFPLPSLPFDINTDSFIGIHCMSAYVCLRDFLFTSACLSIHLSDCLSGTDVVNYGHWHSSVLPIVDVRKFLSFKLLPLIDILASTVLNMTDPPPHSLLPIPSDPQTWCPARLTVSSTAR